MSDDPQAPNHERIVDPLFRRAVDLLDAGDSQELRRYLTELPSIVHQRVVFKGGGYFSNPTLLEFAAENPIRRGKLPANIVEVARVVIEAGAIALNETLGLVCSGCVPRQCGVQLPLIGLLCDSGADPNTATRVAAAHAEFDAVAELSRRGATVDLPIAAATGRIAEARELLPSASSEDRHFALAFAAQFGHSEIVRMLIDAGEDPNRFNPAGAHAHSTPLHQAAYAGHMDVVRLLVEHGTRLDLKDTIYQGTPAGWAHHGGHPEIEQLIKVA